MDNLLREILFRLVEDEWGIHLELADKVLLKNHIEDLFKKGCDDITALTSHMRIYLKDMGYESEKLIKREEKQKEFQEGFTDYILERYDVKRK